MTINLTYDGKTYPLTYTRESVRRMEASGFDIQSFGSKPATMQFALFEGAFYAMNRKDSKVKVSRKTIEEIYDHISQRDDLLSKLVDMYVDTLSSLVGDSEADDGKKAEWEIA